MGPRRPRPASPGKYPGQTRPGPAQRPRPAVGGRRHDMVQTSTREIVLALGQGDAALELAGGKGASLTRMAAAGLPVPRGFILTTTAYRQMIDANGLGAVIEAATADLSEA